MNKISELFLVRKKAMTDDEAWEDAVSSLAKWMYQHSDNFDTNTASYEDAYQVAEQFLFNIELADLFGKSIRK